MFLTRLFYICLVVVAATLAAGYTWPPLFVFGRWLLVLWLLVTVADILLLYHRRAVTAARRVAGRFSNGDDNSVAIDLGNDYPFTARLIVIDEAPVVFQRRNVSFSVTLAAGAKTTLRYTLRPTRRGSYGFGLIRVFARSPLGLVERRYSPGQPVDVKVYPSFLLLKHYELLAFSHRLHDMGIKRIRRAGNNTEFEQIKDYVEGDEFRAINWKASARRHQLMVNVYQDERSQNVYSIIDKGRVMQQAFQGMTLLDYAINAALVLSYIAIRKDDKAGLVTFAERFDSFVPASKRPGQMQTLQESLYAQQTTYGETDYSALCVNLVKHESRRSLLVLYTDFSNVSALRRQLPFLRLLARRHKLLVVFFENQEISHFLTTPSVTTEDYYQHVLAGKYCMEKRSIVSTLKQNGIYALLTTPKELSVNVINKYLDIRRGMGALAG